MNEELWAKCVAYHGHHCPGLAIGVRASLEIIKALPIDFEAGDEIVCVSENESCSVDGIRVVLGCTGEKGNLFFIKGGNQAFSVFNQTTGKSVRLILKDLPQMERDDLEAFLLNEPDVTKLFDFEKPHFELPEKG
ncbi:MAG: formylmethanofuran dehydrogenase subunit E family protein [Acetobacterium sp.]|nr:formylmethanofuran dehydrogenase subunit E family protein [Bacillota bacterium]MCG2729276.1 formylmethanofuran dehydrogenase subunit E family protein [Acetobacterium sp.]